MDIKNADLAIKRINELTEVEKRIDKAKELHAKIINGESGILFQQHKDGSGCSVAAIYRDGGYPKEMYEKIIVNVLSCFEDYAESLREEIKIL